MKFLLSLHCSIRLLSFEWAISITYTGTVVCSEYVCYEKIHVFQYVEDI